MARVVFTGGPGTGKTTLINKLRQKGHVVYDDAAARLIISGKKAPIHAETWSGDFAEMVLAARSLDFKSSLIDELAFFDRGLPDMLGYSLFMGHDATPEVIEAIEKCRYDQVILFPPWEAIYHTNKYRQEDFCTAVKIHENILIAYQKSGYDWIEMPKVSVQERVSFIYKFLDR